MMKCTQEVMILTGIIIQSEMGRGWKVATREGMRRGMREMKTQDIGMLMALSIADKSSMVIDHERDIEHLSPPYDRLQSIISGSAVNS